MEESRTLVLEVLRHDSVLAMSAYEQDEIVETLRQYSQLAVSFADINKLCREVIFILNKSSKTGASSSDYADRLKETGQILWDHLLTRSVKDRLKTTIIRNLILLIDEELVNIPWEILYDGNMFLCLRFNLGRLVRTKDEVRAPHYRSVTTTPKMLMLANPTGDLKSAYLEGVYIKNQLDRKRNEISIDFKSTSIDTLYVKKNLHDYDIVHFAGHCEYDKDNPGNTGWVLRDGRFTTADILALGEGLPLPSLIFSNACLSAKTSTELMAMDYQEKNYSLASAFLFSGVRHYIGTMWKIEDAVSLTFAREFYNQLIKGSSVGECVRLGRIKLIKEFGSTNLFWASYILYGNPKFILFRQRVRPAALKFKQITHTYKKPALRLALAVLIISVIMFLYISLPACNPNNYVSFLKSQRLFQRGDNQQVISLCKQIVKNDPLFLPAYQLIADTYQRLGERENALRYYFDYALSSEKRQDKKHLSFAYSGIAWAYHQQGEYSKAFDFYNKAILLSKDNRDKLNEAIALRKLAVWYMDREDYDKALELLTKSSEINRERQHIYGHRYNLACDYFDMGLVFTNKDDFTAAKEFYNKSCRIFEKLNLKNELSDCYFNLGEICIFEKQYQKALNYYMHGLKIDMLQDNKPNIASDYNMIGELYVEMDDLGKAKDYFGQAIAISKQINARPELAAACYNAGLLYKKKGEKDKAREYFGQAQEIYRLIDTADYRRIQEELISLDAY